MVILLPVKSLHEINVLKIKLTVDCNDLLTLNQLKKSGEILQLVGKD